MDNIPCRLLLSENWVPPKVSTLSYFIIMFSIEKPKGFGCAFPDTNIWVNYNDLTTTSLEIMVSKGNHCQMALIQVSEIL